jgi:hypothetical protein
MVILAACSGEGVDVGTAEQAVSFPSEALWRTVVADDPSGDGGNNGRDIVGDATRPACQV